MSTPTDRKRAFRRLTAVAALGCCFVLFAAADFATGDETQAADVVRPKYRVLRFDEDWSALAGHDRTQTGGLFDPIKYIPLSDDSSIWASFGGHVRSRVESWDHFGFGGPGARHDTFLLQRVSLHGDVHFGDNLRLFAEGRTALATNRELPGGLRALDVDNIDLEQLFVDLTIPLEADNSVTIRPGRQVFLFGKQRLVSPLPWANTMRRWDGVSAIFDLSIGWKVHGFWSQFAPVQKYQFNDPDSQTQFYGVYATGTVPGTPHGLDLYFLGLDRDDMIMFNGTMGSEERYTAGGRVWGKIGDSGLDFDVEGAYQFGQVGGPQVSAFMVGSELGYRCSNCPAQPRLHIGLDYASGDDAAGDDVETFNQLFPLGHAYLGYIDIVGRQNIIDFSSGATLKPIDKMTLKLTGHLFWRADGDDALYNAGGGVVRAGALSNEREVGSEIDLLIKYAFNRHLSGMFGYSHFFAGDFIEESGSAADIDFFYLSMQLTF